MHRCALLVILLAFLTCSFAQQERYHRVTASNCCRRVSSAIVRLKITAYERQPAKGSCIEAIVFRTERGKVCANPRAPWVAKKIKGVPEFPKSDK